MSDTYQFHVKVLLASGVVQNYYPVYKDKTLDLGQFRVESKDGVHQGWIFIRDDETDFFSPDMVKGVSIGPFKGYMLIIGKEEVFCQSTSDSDIIEALTTKQDDLAERLKGVKEYLKCKPC